ncbi:MAG: hypothetical protein M3P83_02135, partial [Actinomycetota bacterium]|nr:hypothetical protein [Actinomycetota bacterium]
MSGGEVRVYLHVGMAKTGTTYLQNRCWANRRFLAEQGLCYPGTQRGAHFQASIDLRATPFVGEESTYVPGAWDEVATAARSARDRALISHETLARATAEQADRALRSLAPAQVHVVVTVRDLARQIPAVWQEMVKNRGVLGYGEFLTAITAASPGRIGSTFWLGQDVVDTLRRWTAAIPPERVHVVTVPPAGAPRGTLWDRFCAPLGLDPRTARRDVSTVNTSMGVAQAEFLRRINPTLHRRLEWPLYARAVKHGLVNRLAAADDAVRLRVPPDLHPWLKERSEAMIAGLAAGGYDVVGDLADLRPVLEDVPAAMPEDVGADQLLEVCGT